MIIQRLIISAGLLFSTFCLPGMKDERKLTEKQQQLFDNWNIDEQGKYKRKVGQEYNMYTLYPLAYPLEKKVKNVFLIKK